MAGALGGPAHLVGHSFGGLVSRAAALAAPHAFRSLTLLDSGPSAVVAPAADNLALLAQALPVVDLETIWAAKRQLEAPTELAPPRREIEDWMHRRFLANHPTSLLRIAEQLLSEPDRVDELAALDLPLLVAYGEDRRRLAATPAGGDGRATRRRAHRHLGGPGTRPLPTSPR